MGQKLDYVDADLTHYLIEKASFMSSMFMKTHLQRIFKKERVGTDTEVAAFLTVVSALQLSLSKETHSEVQS